MEYYLKSNLLIALKQTSWQNHPLGGQHMRSYVHITNNPVGLCVGSSPLPEARHPNMEFFADDCPANKPM